jgi:CRISPR-associated protein Cmr1
MNKLTATYRIVTPMFIGDAYSEQPNLQHPSINLRPPSIKGVLRFWWRALNWGECLKQEHDDISKALVALHTREKTLFGIAAQENQGGQGRFLLQVNPTVLKTQPLPSAKVGIGYLLGQGIYDHNKGYLRNALVAQQKFEVSLCFRRSVEAAEMQSVAEALVLMGCLGGVGSRARKGFGSIAIEGLTGYDYQVPQNTTEYNQVIKNLCRVMPPDLPPFTAFSKHSRVDISSTGRDAWELLNEIGIQMKAYRSFQEEQNFQTDYDLARNVATGTNVSNHPDRVVFGLPHPYFFSSIKPIQDAKVDVHPVHESGTTWTTEERGRRASPLFIHLHQFPNGECAAIQALLPATFLPDADKIEMKGSARHSATCQISPHINWAVLHDFLDRFHSSRTRIYP